MNMSLTKKPTIPSTTNPMAVRVQIFVNSAQTQTTLGPCTGDVAGPSRGR